MYVFNHVHIDIRILTVLKFTIKIKNQENQFSILCFCQKKGIGVCELDISFIRFLCIVL